MATAKTILTFRSLIAALALTSASRATEAEAQFPETYPAVLVQSDQCEETSPLSRRAYDQINREVRIRIVNEIAPVISRYYGTCSLGRCKENPVFSCAEVREMDRESESGHYWLRLSNGSSVNVYCNFNRQCGCPDDATASWTRVAFYNMSDSTHQCPFNFQLNEVEQRRMCTTKYSGCTSVYFDTLGLKYTRVCGRVIGVQYGELDAFRPYFRYRERTLEDPYVDGVSLTHGQAPRTHVWTFATAADETEYDDEACPCTRTDRNYEGAVPPFIGDDYFCDTGSSRLSPSARYYLDDPLWDGAGCGATSACCQWQNPPWFCKHLPEPTRNTLEFRVCSDSSTDHERLLLELIEVYIL
jgi:hypothetical protein